MISRIALATTLIVITILALLPINTIRGIELTFWKLPIAADKIAHLMAFLVISGFMDSFQYQYAFNLKTAAIAALYGIYIEGLQSLTDYRHPSFWDIVANCVGIFMYWALTPLW
nr:VanZ family protein [Endozoicomonas sp.]